MKNSNINRLVVVHSVNFKKKENVKVNKKIFISNIKVIALIIKRY